MSTSLYFFLSLSLSLFFSLVFFSLLLSSMAAEMDGNGGGGGWHQGQSGGVGGGDDNDLDLVSECSRCVCRQWPMRSCAVRRHHTAPRVNFLFL